MPKAGSRTAKPTRTKPATNSEETPEAAIRRLAGELQQCQQDLKSAIKSHEGSLSEIDDLHGIIRRECVYHRLRADELLRDLNNYGINI